MYQNCVLVGRFTKEVELKYIPGSGTAVTETSIAIDRETKEKQTDFFNVKAFGKLAETIANYTDKGSLVMLNGVFQNRTWQDKEGNKRYSTEFIINKIKFLDSKKNAEINSSFTPSGFDEMDMSDIPF